MVNSMPDHPCYYCTLHNEFSGILRARLDKDTQRFGVGTALQSVGFYSAAVYPLECAILPDGWAGDLASPVILSPSVA